MSCVSVMSWHVVLCDTEFCAVIMPCFCCNTTLLREIFSVMAGIRLYSFSFICFTHLFNICCIISLMCCCVLLV